MNFLTVLVIRMAGPIGDTLDSAPKPANVDTTANLRSNNSAQSKLNTTSKVLAASIADLETQSRRQVEERTFYRDLTLSHIVRVSREISSPFSGPRCQPCWLTTMGAMAKRQLLQRTKLIGLLMM